MNAENQSPKDNNGEPTAPDVTRTQNRESVEELAKNKVEETEGNATMASLDHPKNQEHTGAHKEGNYDKQQNPEDVGDVGKYGQSK